MTYFIGFLVVMVVCHYCVPKEMRDGDRDWVDVTTEIKDWYKRL